MDTLTVLHTRHSTGQLEEPGPTSAQLNNIIKAGLRASDHGRLRPWRFLLIEGDARHKLGDLFVQAALQDKPDLGEGECNKLKSNPLRAPIIIVVIARVRPNDKIPEVEQLLSAAGAAQLMLLAAHAQGLGAIWRTGKMAYDKRVLQGLGLEDDNQVIGFLYFGSSRNSKTHDELNIADYLIQWTG